MIEGQIYKETQKNLEQAEKGTKRSSLGLISDLKRHQKSNVEMEVRKRVVMEEVYSETREPQFYNNARIKAKVNLGGQVFERMYGRD